MRLGIDTTKTQAASCQCPACAGLGGLERPRYFSGQLLTEAELNSEQAYVLAKNRLHNRYLHGAGVVCGLQVFCSKNAGYVSIQPGYALDPCGNDIIVGDTQEFDVIKRIHECDNQLRQRRRSDCSPMKPSTEQNCKDIVRYYCLTIAYQEIESRPINALRKGTTASSSSNGKGNGCGCQSSQSGMSTSAFSSTMTQSSQISCQPTRISEEYVFDVVEVPPDYCRNVQDLWESTLLAKVVAQLKEVKAFLDSRLRGTNTYETLIPLTFTGNTDASPQMLYESCCRLRQAIKDLYAQNPCNTHCVASDLFTQVVCQPPADNGGESYMQQMRMTLYQLLALLTQYILNGICQLLTPPCSAEMEDRLILACFTVKNDVILDICDFCHRRSAGSFPTLYYWLSLVPVVPLIAYAVERICCYDWLTATGSQGGQPAEGLMNGLTLLLDRIDPSESLRKAIFAENFAWPRSYADRFEQIIQSVAPSKITAFLHPEAFNLATIINTPLNKASEAMNKAGITPIVREVASVNDVPILSNLTVPPFARPGDQIVVYRVGDNVVAYAAYAPSSSLEAVQPQVTEMQATVNTLKEELDALRKEVAQLRTSRGGGKAPPPDKPKS